MAGINTWTEEQITVVLYEYCRRPFGSTLRTFLPQCGLTYYIQ